MKIFCDLNEKDLLPGIEEAVEKYKTTASDPEVPLPVHLIPDEGEISGSNESIKSSELMYLKK